MAVNNTHCEHNKPFVDSLSKIQDDMSHKLLDVIHNIEQLIPHRRQTTQRIRHTRSWLPFLGRVLKTVTGTATTADILTKINRAIDQLRRVQATAYNQWSHTEGQIASMMHIADKRTAALHTLVQNQRQAMITQYKEFSGSINDLFAMNDIIPTVLERIMDFTGVWCM